VPRMKVYSPQFISNPDRFLERMRYWTLAAVVLLILGGGLIGMSQGTDDGFIGGQRVVTTTTNAEQLGWGVAFGSLGSMLLFAMLIGRAVFWALDAALVLDEEPLPAEGTP
jgi:hypothetical protein